MDCEHEQSWGHKSQHVHNCKVHDLKPQTEITFFGARECFLNRLEGEETTIDPSFSLTQKPVEVPDGIDPSMSIR